MDFLGFTFTPQGVTDLIAQGVILGATVGLLFTILTLFYGRSLGA